MVDVSCHMSPHYSQEYVHSDILFHDFLHGHPFAKVCSLYISRFMKSFSFFIGNRISTNQRLIYKNSYVKF